MITTSNDQPDKLHSKVSVMWEKYRREIKMELMAMDKKCPNVKDIQSCQQTYREYIKSKLTRNI
jgi:hypothetical protein